MFNPTRRNKNIGTENQGFGRDNRNVISSSWHDSHLFWEKLVEYKLVRRSIHDKEYKFLVERTRKASLHPCTVDDVAKIIGLLDPDHLEGLDLIVLRQPKRKEENLKPVWGRLAYYAQIKGHNGSAIILESFDFDSSIKWSKSLDVEDRKEFERLQNDGHKMIENKRDFTILTTISGFRNTQLYRTFIHEVGHYVQYLEKVYQPSLKDEEHDFWEDYSKITRQEKETFAHSYAERTAKELRSKGLIPFNRILNETSIKAEHLNLSDFAFDGAH